MAIRFFCVHCGRQYRVPGELAGKKAKCKKCGGTMNIPSLDASESVDVAPQDGPSKDRGDSESQSFEFNCPECFGSILADRDRIGQPMTCPQCQQEIVIGDTETAATPPAPPKKTKQRDVRSAGDTTVTTTDRVFMGLGTLGLSIIVLIILLGLTGLLPDSGIVSVNRWLGMGLIVVYGLSGVVRARLTILSRKRVITGTKARVGGGVTILCFFVALSLLAVLIGSLQAKDPAIRHYNKGIQLAQPGYLDSAIEEFEQAVRIEPYFARGYEALALAWTQKGHYETAWSYIERCWEVGGRPDAQLVEDLRRVLGK